MTITHQDDPDRLCCDSTQAMQIDIAQFAGVTHTIFSVAC